MTKSPSPSARPARRRFQLSQVSSAKYPVSASASGVLASESVTVKTSGHNGPQYNGTHLKGLLDDYPVYDRVATIDDVVELTPRGTVDFDPASAARVTVPAEEERTSTPTASATYVASAPITREFA